MILRAPSPRLLKWTAAGLAALVLAVVLALALLQWNANALRGPIAHVATRHLQRTVAIKGPLRLRLLSLSPRASVAGISIANPPWAGHGDLLRIGHLDVALALGSLLRGQLVLQRVQVDGVELHLIRDASDRANWRFGPTVAPQPTRAPSLPVVRSLRIRHAQLDVTDAIRKLIFKARVHAKASGAAGEQALRLEGTGAMNGADFEAHANGDSLITAEEGRPYAFSADVRAGTAQVSARVQVTKPFDLNSLSALLTASGDDLADLYYLTGLTLPNTPPYKISANVQWDGKRVEVRSLAGTLGRSDVHGSAVIDMAGRRPVATAELTSRALNIDDLAAALGAGSGSALSPTPAEQARAGVKKITPPTATPDSNSNALLLPDAPLDVERVRGMDATVTYHAGSVIAQKIPFRAVDARLNLKHGILTIDPLSFTLPEGKVDADLRVDATRDDPDVTLNGKLSAVRLSQFHPAHGDPPLEGVLLGRIAAEGHGRSVHAVASTAAGTVTAVIPHGEIRAAFAELTGINVTHGLGLILTGSHSEDAVRCGVADFQAKDGVLNAKDIVVDTQNVLITGKGNINLRSEKLDMSVSGAPKKPRLVRLKTPIKVGGTLLHPSVGLQAGNAATQAAAATALGALLTPLAAILAFIDPGLAKNADCGALLTEARNQGAPLPPDETPPPAQHSH
jgi:uncharacterized protein involved in outer membrane biogenesis